MIEKFRLQSSGVVLLHPAFWQASPYLAVLKQISPDNQSHPSVVLESKKDAPVKLVFRVRKGRRSL
jgi:hypothetical protein